jgi:tRNA-5-taurinomethyluridine 2-sulfurtransferase
MKIAVLVSGGVDSSVALQLLKEQGHDLIAFYLKIWLEDELAYLGNCPWQEDLAFVEQVCQKLNVPLKIISLQEEYWKLVVAYTVDEVKEGRTPSPDLLCNQQIKFGAFFDKIDASFDKIATGHYAQVDHSSPLSQLKKANDPFKDQTYFLARLSQQQLSRALFPIGHLTKPEVRERAERYDLATQSRKDSQGICFLGKIKFSDFIKHHVGTKTGDLIEIETGKKISEHKGFWFYTIGQRKGIGLSGGPWFVVSKDPELNIVYVSKNYHAEEKIRNQFYVSSFNWLSGNPPAFQEIDLSIKIRHGESFYSGRLTFLDDSKNHGLVIIDGNDQGIAPGQFAVFYDRDICLGSAVIDNETTVIKD